MRSTRAIAILLGFGIDRLLAELAGAIANQATFEFTGDPQTFVVPVRGQVLAIEACGAQGGTGAGPAGGAGGLGCSSGTYAATVGETLDVYVGGSGDPFNGAGPGGNDSGATGGGASDVRAGGTDLANRILVGVGGGLAGGDGASSLGGFGGTSGLGGAPGAGCGGCLGAPGTDEGVGGGAGAGGTSSLAGVAGGAA